MTLGTPVLSVCLGADGIWEVCEPPVTQPDELTRVHALERFPRERVPVRVGPADIQVLTLHRTGPKDGYLPVSELGSAADAD